MKALLDNIRLLVLGLLLHAIALLAVRGPFANMAEGELRCESGGAVVVRVAGKDYAANGRRSSRYPSIQQIWNSHAYPSANIDRLVVCGLFERFARKRFGTYCRGPA